MLEYKEPIISSPMRQSSPGTPKRPSTNEHYKTATAKELKLKFATSVPQSLNTPTTNKSDHAKLNSYFMKKMFGTESRPTDPKVICDVFFNQRKLR